MLREYQDVWSENTSPIGGFLEDLCTMSDQEVFPDYPREHPEEIKIEVPLMRDQPDVQLGPCEPDDFKSFLETQLNLDSDFAGGDPQPFSDDNLEEQLQDAAQAAIQRIEQEQLQAIDALGRVPIPIMDFSISEPEWTRLGHDEKAIFEWIRNGNEQLFKSPRWPIHKTTESKLVWIPFAPGTIPAPENEQLDVAELILQDFLAPLDKNEIPSSRVCLYHRDKPAVFKDEDGDEEIDTVLLKQKPATALMDIIRKRSLEDDAGGISKKPRRNVQSTTPDSKPEVCGPQLLVGDTQGASAKLLANFLEVHAPKKKIWTGSQYFNSSKIEPSTSTPANASGSVQAPDEFQKRAIHPSPHPTKADMKAPCPSIHLPLRPLTIFISVKIPRRMIRVLEGLVPGLTLIERNYDAHNTSTWRAGSVVRTEVVSPLADDADITISPTCGLILTSMIRLRQKPREGSHKGLVQTRIEKTCLRYERLLVLVGGEGGSDDTLSRISSSESMALIELQGFASGLDCDIQVHYVGGGAKTLANWVAASICRYGLVEPETSTGLLEVETLWELFLRRAGLNVFAAQMIAGQLNQPRQEAPKTAVQHGLGAFITMTRAERMRRFGQLIGSKVLERVNKSVDEQWNQD